MPPPKKVAKLEKLIEKGLDVEYPRTPWFTDNKDAIVAESKERERRIKEGQHADLLEKIPADRSKGRSDGKPRIQRKIITKTIKLPI